MAEPDDPLRGRRAAAVGAAEAAAEVREEVAVDEAAGADEETADEPVASLPTPESGPLTRPEPVANTAATVTEDVAIVAEEAIEVVEAPVVASSTVASRPAPGPKPIVGELADAESLAQIRRYKVRRGETLNDIAAKFNVSVRELQESNPRLSSNGLLPGQVIRIR